jgi:hypothetical protein
LDHAAKALHAYEAEPTSERLIAFERHVLFLSAVIGHEYQHSLQIMMAEEGKFWPHQTGEGGFYWEYLFFGGHLVSVNAFGGHKGRAHNPKKPSYLAICRKQSGQKGRDRSFFVVSDNHITAIVDGKSQSTIHYLDRLHCRPRWLGDLAPFQRKEGDFANSQVCLGTLSMHPKNLITRVHASVHSTRRGRP